MGGCSAIPASSSTSKSRWFHTAASDDLARSSERSPRWPAKTMWTTCFAGEPVGAIESARATVHSLRPGVLHHVAQDGGRRLVVRVWAPAETFAGWAESLIL